MLPSASLDGVGTLEEGLFAAQYLAHMPPVNASQSPLRTHTHDSGPMRFATPSSYETFTHYLSPVLTGAPRADPSKASSVPPGRKGTHSGRKLLKP
jgi:hypothetical protein